jgi:asparagine synthetase B (glutamine-hydrolysing)
MIIAEEAVAFRLTPPSSRFSSGFSFQTLALESRAHVTVPTSGEAAQELWGGLFVASAVDVQSRLPASDISSSADI